jgi:hypothetical protein
MPLRPRTALFLPRLTVSSSETGGFLTCASKLSLPQPQLYVRQLQKKASTEAGREVTWEGAGICDVKQEFSTRSAAPREHNVSQTIPKTSLPRVPFIQGDRQSPGSNLGDGNKLP